MFSQFENNQSFNSFQAVQEYLDKLGLFHMDLSLTRMLNLLNRLFPKGFPFKVVQVVGTNGKGSTSHFMSALATAHAHKNGLYTSPHFVSMRERVRVNGKMLAEQEWTLCANIVAAAQSSQEDEKLTYFEFITALALIAFARAQVELAILEAGLGGKYDATSAVPADLLLITPISLDHQNVLGQELLEIAANKAGAMKPGQIIITSEQEPDVLALLKAKANALGNSLFKPVRPGSTPDENNEPKQRPQGAAVEPEAKSTCSPSSSRSPCSASHANKTPALGMMGMQQADNSRLALAGFSHLAQKLGWPLRPPAIRRGLGGAFIPGRMQFIPALFNRPPLLLDGAHNQHSFEVLRYNLKNLGICPRAIIFSCLSDKNMDEAFASLCEWSQNNPNSPIFIPPLPNNPRAANPAELAKRIGPNAKVTESMREALHLAEQLPTQLPKHLPKQATTPKNTIAPENRPVLICGSLYLLAEFFKLHPGYLETK